MRIYRPLKTNYRTQAFGENKACVRFSSPLKVVGKSFNQCPANFVELYPAMGLKGHNGEDWACWYEEPIYFSTHIAGMTWHAKTEVDNAGGIGVDVISDKKFVFNGKTDYIKFRFWHFKSTVVKDGDPVTLGQLLGYGDSTGMSSGNHLHWGIKWCEEDGRAKYSDNGYRGAWDFSPYMTNIFILDHFQIDQMRSALNTLKSKLLEFRKFLDNFKLYN